MKKRISFFALAAIFGFISCDLMGPEALFLQDPASIGPIIGPQGTDPDSSETDPFHWMDFWDLDSSETGPCPWKDHYVDPDSSDIDPNQEPDSSNTGES